MAKSKKDDSQPARTIRRAPRKLEGLDQKTLALIESTATRVRAKIDQRTLP